MNGSFIFFLIIIIIIHLFDIVPFSHSRSLYSVMSTHRTRQHNMKSNSTNKNKIKRNYIFRRCSGGRREVFLSLMPAGRNQQVHSDLALAWGVRRARSTIASLTNKWSTLSMRERNTETQRKQSWPKRPQTDGRPASLRWLYPDQLTARREGLCDLHCGA